MSTSSSTSSTGTGGHASACGDGTVDAGEACDDGNQAEGDGCSASCVIEKGYTCSGSPSVCATTCGDGVAAGAETCDDGNTTDGDGCAKDCATETGYACTGEPSICTTVCGDGVLVGTEACDDGDTTDGDGCNATCTVEDGWTCDMTPSMCAPIFGDGLIVGPETCDDNNTTDGDGCSATSTIEDGYTCAGTPSVCETVCGDGIIAGDETCDDGDADNSDGCSASCVKEDGWICDGEPSVCTTTCGDGIIAGDETCDDTNAKDGDGCSATCTTIETGWACVGEPSVCSTTCGDGIIAGTETCDDTNTASNDGCNASCATESGWTCTGSPSTCATTCGDGKVAGQETCDDGNANPADGCDACKAQPGWLCTGEPSKCVTVCGDGKIAGQETCDDGNANSADGCSSACTIELGWTCAGAPSVCTTTCGDGIPVGTETCDDGGNVDGDGCDATCHTQTGYACTGAPSVCGPICGDGIKVLGEKCDDGNTNNGDGCTSTCQLEPGFEIEPNNTAATANDFEIISVNGKVNGLINVAGDADYFFFIVPAGKTGTLSAATITNFQGHVCDSTNASDSKLTIYDSAGTQLAVNDDNGVNWCSAVTSPSLQPGTYYLVATHHSATLTMAYTIQASLTLATCGNGIKELSEACDDGNTTNGDGCSSTCKLEPIIETEPNNTCATANGAYTLPPNVLVGGTITNLSDVDFFKFTLTNYADVRLETFDANGPGTCASIDTQIQVYNSACTSLGSDDESGINSCSLLEPVANSFMKHVPPGTYYVKVFPWTSAAVPFNYTMLASYSAICGNGIVEGSEKCDGTPFCAPDCFSISPGCGNGIIDAGETCDDGNTVGGDGCSATCTFECPAGQTLFTASSTLPPTAIPDDNPAGLLSPINVPLSGAATVLAVQVNITHTWDSDVDIYLVSPAGTTLDISTDNGSSGDNYNNTVLSDLCSTPVTSGVAPFNGCYKPEQPLSTVNGQAANGAWTLKVVDDLVAFTGTLNSWSITMCVQ